MDLVELAWLRRAKSGQDESTQRLEENRASQSGDSEVRLPFSSHLITLALMTHPWQAQFASREGSQPVVPPADSEPTAQTSKSSTTVTAIPSTPPAESVSSSPKTVTHERTTASAGPSRLWDPWDPTTEEEDGPLLLNLMNTREQLLKRMATIVYYQRVGDVEDVARLQELAAEKQTVKTALKDIDRFVRQRHRKIQMEKEARERRR